MIIQDFINEQIENLKYGDNTFLVLDGVTPDKKKDKRLRDLSYNSNKYKMTCYLSSQGPLGLTPDIRVSIDYTFIFKPCNIGTEIEKLYKNYAGVFPTIEIFRKVLNACIGDYNCLVINNVVNSNKLEDQVFMYKASYCKFCG